jgi:hypothetical protein
VQLEAQILIFISEFTPVVYNIKFYQHEMNGWNGWNICFDFLTHSISSGVISRPVIGST